MGMKDEMLFDFSLRLPRVLISGRNGVLDNVKKIVLISDTSIVVDCGRKFTGVSGAGLTVDWLGEERMLISGEIRSVEFYGGDGDEN
ncbi:YabP/YqfC family sporulation protein [Bacilliculturomica massiliensis]|uniref:YabP/YqfC family sporulation protein n=1 Tax=Bacilliculturomica massiliensis TaxID=1917867 RepID=UPI0013EF185E|nr:YabP/YqfC family sporulation protein [Bacilliculturomica massiliensis]